MSADPLPRSSLFRHLPAVLGAVLPRDHRNFLRALRYDEQGYPLYQGKHAGIGGVYHLVK